MAGIRRVAISILGVGLAALAACGDDGPESCLPECPGERSYDAVAYHLSARFDWDTSTLHAVEDLRLAPASDVVELDADVEVTAVRAGDRALAFANDREAGTLRVDLGPVRAAEVDFTVEYTAETSGSLVIGGPRDDDPVSARVVYTDSEPDRGLRWLVAKHDPSDRARWSVDVTAPLDHDVIANGTRADDQVVGSGRVVSYHLDQPIPTYLMAFAEGELDHVERTGGRVPLALWFRRGLSIDPDDNLDAVADAMATFDALIGPYPWDRYAVVLLPGFGGGMENATITFNDEGSALGAVSFGLNAHELAHQWFGDWVTMRGYDDVWIKEGLATFLAAEATRAWRDRAGSGRYFGTDFPFFPDHAIVDPALTGLGKYTTGPYERAAWLITQLRSIVGEDAFWAGLRRVLAEHAVADVDGDGFLRSFTPALPEATRLRMMDSLILHGAPRVDVLATSAAGVTNLTLTLSDPTRILAAPVDVTVIDAAGAATTTALIDAAQVTVVVPAGGYLAPDERGVHPRWPDVLDAPDAYFDEMVPRFTPGAAPAWTALRARSTAHQELAWRNGGSLPPAADFSALYNDLDSVEAQRSAVLAACLQLRNLAPTDPDFTVLEDRLRLLLWSPSIRRYTNMAACPPALTEQVFGNELQTIGASPATAASIEYMIGFDYGTTLSLSRIGRFATGAPSLDLRDVAISRLLSQTYSFTSYSRIPDNERPAWRTFFRDRLPLTTSSGRLQRLWTAAVNLGDLDALPAVAPLLHSVTMSESLQTRIVCEASQLTAARPDLWQAFQAATMPWDTLSPGAAAALANPSTCNQKPAAPPAASDDDAMPDHVRHLHAVR